MTLVLRSVLPFLAGALGTALLVVSPELHSAFCGVM